MASSELVTVGGGGVIALVVSAGAEVLRRWKEKGRRSKAVERAVEAQRIAEEQRDRVVDAIPSLVAAEVARVLPLAIAEAGGAWRTQTGTTMPSTAALRDMIRVEVAAYGEQSERAQNVSIVALEVAIDRVYKLMIADTRRSTP